MMFVRYRYRMRLLFLFCITSTFSHFLVSQDTATKIKRVQPGVMYSVFTGNYYGHAFGFTFSKNSHHQFEMSAILMPGENPFKEKANFGAMFRYHFLPNKNLNRFNLLFETSLL